MEGVCEMRRGACVKKYSLRAGLAGTKAFAGRDDT